MRLVIKRYLTTGQLLKRSRERGSDEHEIPIMAARLEYCTHVKTTVMLEIEAWDILPHHHCLRGLLMMLNHIFF
jgi:hypothetical protein